MGRHGVEAMGKSIGWEGSVVAPRSHDSPRVHTQIGKLVHRRTVLEPQDPVLGGKLSSGVWGAWSSNRELGVGR